MDYREILDKKVSCAVKNLVRGKTLPQKLSTKQVAEEVGTDKIFPTLDKLLISVGWSMRRLGHSQYRTMNQRYWIVFEILE